MPEKLDLFELSVKRGLENYEVPMEEGAWNQFQTHMNTGGGSGSASNGGASFLGRFGVAAAVLTAAGLFINYGTDFSQNHIAADRHEAVETESTYGTSEQTSQDESTYVVESTEASSVSELEKLNAEKENVSSEILEEKRILTINQKLQDAADRVENQEKDLEKKTTTRYVGKNFNLGAASEFSPNGDGKDDNFLPSALTAHKRFTMTISDATGKRVFRSNRLDSPWNGTDSLGKDAREGHYSWEVILHKDNNSKEIFRGVVKLER